MEFTPNQPVVYEFSGFPKAIVLQPGFYLFELWGAQGGTNQSDHSPGGYSSGFSQILEETSVFLNVGGMGTFSSTAPRGGFNGGGDGFIGWGNFPCGGGGGATDLRLYTNNISSRFLIAGGGGGDGYYLKYYEGGYGGGKEGGNGTNWGDPRRANGIGGNQQSGGEEAFVNNLKSGPGTLGQGGIGAGIQYSGGGGGGGLYGGSGAYEVGGGGGSGYSNPFLQNQRLLSGGMMMPQINGLQKKGHYGNGCARITKLSRSLCKLSCKTRISAPNTILFSLLFSVFS